MLELRSGILVGVHNWRVAVKCLKLCVTFHTRNLTLPPTLSTHLPSLFCMATSELENALWMDAPH